MTSAPESQTAKKTDRLSQLLKGELEGSAWWFAMGFAALLGAGHATAPGHGKTMVAAYLVGQRGTAWHALLLGLTTTFTHTVSVFALGAATYVLAGALDQQRITRILEFLSGASIVVLGLWLLRKRVRALQGVSESGFHTHEVPPEEDASLGSLIALGASGGLVPCPSALVLLLTAISMGKVATGLTLLVAFSLGLAVVLVAIGLTVVYARSLLPQSWMGQQNAVLRYLPVLSALVIVGVGALLTAVAAGYVKLPG